jgi:thiol-disulfide isomerase/thioredoxin
MRHALVALVALVALSACSGTGDGPAAKPHPSGGPPCVVGDPSPSGSASTGPALADLALACFAGGGEVRIAHLGRPAVINLWASWCEPCRKELPAFESYAQRAPAGLLIIGVATDTTRGAAQSIIDEFGLTFPTLNDPDRKLMLAVGRGALPVTLFVDARGRLAHLYNSSALDGPAIERLVAEHLGVR